MVVDTSYDQIMDKDEKLADVGRKPLTEEEIEKYVEFLNEHWAELCDVLEPLQRELFLLFKVNDYIRAIDLRLG